uniref:Cyclic GMP-AMP synthase isoform X2 n=1 Tax=Pogona vitticeps TaxID=103695 RepID=A0ABM5GDP5_9SAUR
MGHRGSVAARQEGDQKSVAEKQSKPKLAKRGAVGFPARPLPRRKFRFSAGPASTTGGAGQGRAGRGPRRLTEAASFPPRGCLLWFLAGKSGGVMQRVGGPPGRRRGAREGSSAAPPGGKEEEEEAALAPPAPASKGGRGRQGKGENAGRPARSKGSLLNEEPASELGREGAVPRKASLKRNGGSASKAREAKPEEADGGPLEKQSAACPAEESSGALPRDGPGQAGRRRAAAQAPGPRRPPLEAGKEVARRGRRSGQKRPGGAPQEEGSGQAEEEEERAEPAEQGLPSQPKSQEGDLPGKKAERPGTGAGAAATKVRKSRPAPVEEPAGADPKQKGALILPRVLEKLKLAKEERSKAAQLVNKVRDTVVAAIRKSPCFREVEPLGAGSYYERVKVCSPNEFDILLKMPGLRFELETCDVSGSCGAFYYIKMKRNPQKGNLNKFIENDRLSSCLVLSELTKIIKEGVKETEDVKVSTKRPGCPAVTLLIGKEPSVITVDIVLGVEFRHTFWGNSTKNGLDIERWLGKKVKQEFHRAPLYLVPKNVKEGRAFIGNTWRLSFSVIEKEILNNHGSTKTCCEKCGSPCCRDHEEPG